MSSQIFVTKIKRSLMNGKVKPTLRGEHVTLRPITVADTDVMLAATRDAETNRLTGTQASFAREQIMQWCERMATDEGRIDLAITSADSGEFMGDVVLNDLDGVNRSAAFRIALSSAHLGRGYGSEAARLILAYGFETLGLNRVSLEVFAFNYRAQHVYEKLGFQREGRLREVLWMDGDFHDAIVMSLLRREWELRSTPRAPTNREHTGEQRRR